MFASPGVLFDIVATAMPHAEICLAQPAVGVEVVQLGPCDGRPFGVVLLLVVLFRVSVGSPSMFDTASKREPEVCKLHVHDPVPRKLEMP